MNHKATLVSLTNLSHSAPLPPSSLHVPKAFYFLPSFLCLQFHFFKKRKLEQSERLVSFIFCHRFLFAVSMFYKCLYFLYFKQNVT